MKIMNKCTKIDKLEEVENNYDIFFIDLWGVIHNGVEIFENVKSTLKRLKEKKKKDSFYHKCTKKN